VTNIIAYPKNLLRYKRILFSVLKLSPQTHDKISRNRSVGELKIMLFGRLALLAFILFVQSCVDGTVQDPAQVNFTVTSISPGGGPLAGGNTITISGSKFGPSTTVDIGGSPCTPVTVIDGTTLTCTSPALAAATYNVTVTSPGDGTVTFTNGYSSNPAPTVGGVNIPAGALAGGTAIQITGTGFLASPTVTIGGAVCNVTASTATTVDCITGAAVAGTYAITVTNYDAQFATLAAAYTYQPAPSIAGLLPATGSTAGGTLITINGADFIATPTVTIGGAACAGVTWVNANQLTCTHPAGAAGAANVVVTNPDGQLDTSVGGFTYVPPPTVTSITPAVGAAAGGALVTIAGTNFLAGATITVDGVACTPGTITATSIICNVGAGTATGPGAVVVTNPDTQAGTLAASFEYLDPPTVTIAAPTVGFSVGGTSVTITGTNFYAGASVSFGGSACAVTAETPPTSITCTTSAHADGLVNIVVTNIDGQAGTGVGLYTYEGAPTITSIVPAGGSTAGGNVITINGTNFRNTPADPTVTIDGNPCAPLTYVGTTQVTCSAPAGTIGAKDLVLTNADTQSATATGGYLYAAPPTISTITPTVGASAGGTAVVIDGTDFQAGATVDLGGSPCTVTATSTTQISCTTTAHAAGPVTVTVTNPDTQVDTLGTGFVFLDPPTLVSTAPTTGFSVGGNTITLTGTNFFSGATVDIGGAACTNMNVVNATTATCDIGPNTAGTYTVTFTNPDGQNASLAAYFTYADAPTITATSPYAGDIAGGTLLTIDGTNFVAGATVTINAVACAVGANTGTQITCTTGASAAGTYDIVVTNPDTQTATETNGYTYQNPPTVTAISPTGGALAGGTFVTITGTDFVNTTAVPNVDINGNACTGVTYVNATTLTCFTAAEVAGTYGVDVTNDDGQTDNLAAAYTYRVAPTVTSVTAPAAGPLAGGNLITINGTDFINAPADPTVTINGGACTGLTYVGATQVTCNAPPNVAGTYDVVLTNPDNQTGTGSALYTYQAAPTITSISPVGGDTAGGTPITITGSGFLAGATVDLGGSACGTVVVVNATTITCTTTAHIAGAVLATVTNTDTQAGTLAAGYTYADPPTITLTAPAAGSLFGGTSVTLTGTNFVAGATVDIGGSACTVTAQTPPTSITCTTTANGAGTYTVTVTNPDTQTGTDVAAYTYQPGPSPASVAPTFGPLAGGGTLTITGTDFIAGATVTVGGNPCAVTAETPPTSIDCTIPAGLAGAANVTVTNPDSQTGTLISAYSYVNAPTITGINPIADDIAGGATITIDGSGFQTGISVDIGGNPCAVVTQTGAQITCTTAATGAGTYNVTVTNTDTQSDISVGAFTFGVTPTITTIAPSYGPLAGGGNIVLTGTGFVTGQTVTVGGNPCVFFAETPPTSYTCTVPGPNAGAQDVVVTLPNTLNVTSVGGYTYQAAPTVTSVSPVGGPLTGGTLVTITGTNFQAGATVDFIATACTGVTVVNATTITCTTPANVAGAANVIVTNTDAQTGTGVGLFNYANPPAPAVLGTNNGPEAGGTSIVITGTDFQAGATVDIGGVACAVTAQTPPTSITCTSGAQVAGTYTLTVTNIDSQAGALVGSYTYNPAPTITSTAPTTGALAGGTAVTITGTGFLVGASVDIGGSACTVGAVTPITINCTTTANIAGTYTVTVTNPDTQSATDLAAFTYQAAPTVTSITPDGGNPAGGTVVTIAGTNFVTGATVDIGGSGCTVGALSATSITCTTTANAAGAYTVTVTNPDTQFGTLASYTYQNAPCFTSIAPTGGDPVGGESVVITGTDFIAGATVTIDSLPCTVTAETPPTSITCTTPANVPGSYNVVVTNPDTQFDVGFAAFTYTNPPSVASISPIGGPTAGGQSVTITGNDFVGGASVSIGGSACTITSLSATSITCNTTANGGGLVGVTVTNPDLQNDTLAAAYTYQAAPTVTSTNPTGGDVTGGNTVSIIGTNFLAGATATFDGTACTSPIVISPTQLDCNAPAHVAGTVNVVVTNPDTQTGTGVGVYTYAPPPDLVSILPTSGTLAGGTSIVLTGTDFQAGATVTVDGTACPVTAETPPTSITCTTPAKTAGTYDVVVTNPDTQDDPLIASYTYTPIAILEWQVGAISPNPPNPDNYGTTAVNVSHTYTLENVGDLTTSTITVQIAGADPAAFFILTDNCSGAGNELAPAAQCTVTISFLGAFNPAATTFNAILRASATTGGTSDNDMTGTTP
jgi:hypothetical protein